MKRGRVLISSHFLLDLMQIDSKTHTVKAAVFVDDTLHVLIDGPEMPEVTKPEHINEFTPVYRRDYARLEEDRTEQQEQGKGVRETDS